VCVCLCVCVLVCICVCVSVSVCDCKSLSWRHYKMECKVGHACDLLGIKSVDES